jgi:hypothetical protein
VTAHDDEALEKLARRHARSSRWQLAVAAFELGKQRGAAEQAYRGIDSPAVQTPDPPRSGAMARDGD